MAESIDRITATLADRYEIQREIGRGGMATVFLAHDRRHGRPVAIKVLKESLSHDVAADRFLAEIRIAAQLVHPHILPVFDSGGDRDCLYYVMPFVDGETLRARQQREGTLRTSEAVRIACEIGEALSYAHANGIVHRDIKPENILLAQGHAVLADFGVARALQQAGNDRLTTIGLTVGTPLYMSPEQASGLPDVDGRSDIFSLGCVLYEMLAGEAPHAADSPPFVIAQKFTAVAPLSKSRPDTPPNVLRALEGALAIERHKRFATVDQFVDTLTPRGSRPIARVVSGGKTKRRVVIGVAVAAAAVAAFAAALVSSRRSSPPPASASSRLSVAVFPFRATDASAAQWQEAIPDLLATALDGVPGISVTDPWSLWRNLRPDPQSHAQSPSPEEAVQLARNAGASLFILGSVTLLEREVQLSVRMYRGDTAAAWQTFGVSGPADSVGSLIRQVSLETIRRLSLGSATSALLTEQHGLTRSPDALKAWLSARESRRRGQIDSADAAIDRAIALDSNFALALVDAASIKSWVSFMKAQPYSPGMRGLVQRADSLSSGASERARLRARAMLASLNTEGGAAAAALNGVLAIDSTDFDAWSLLSYVQMAYGWQFGQSPADAMASNERVLRADSTDASGLLRRNFLAFATNDVSDLPRQAARLRRADTTSGLIRGALLASRAFALDDRAFADRVGEFANAGMSDWVAVLRYLRMYRPDRAELLLDSTRRPSSPLLQLARNGTIQLTAAQGRWRALDSLRAAGAFAANTVDRTIDRMFVAGAIAGAGDEERARRSVMALSKDFPPDSLVAFLDKRPAWHDGWLIGAFEAMYGDTAVARAWQREFVKLPTKGASPETYNLALRDDIAARIALRHGDRANALVYAHRAYKQWTIHTENQFEMMPEPAMRFQLAALLRASGAVDSARALFSSLTLPTTWMGFYTARASLELAELSEEARDFATAQRHYLTVNRMWERGDTSIGALRERAKRGALRVGEGSPRQ